MREYPSYPLLGIAVLAISDEGRILFVKRKYPPQQFKWSLPGGHMELGESLLGTARRELKEETGLDSQPIGIVDVSEYITYDSSNRIYRQYILVYVLVTSLSGELRPGSDALDAEFYYPSEAFERLDLAETTKVFLQKMMKGKLPLIKPEVLIFRID